VWKVEKMIPFYITFGQLVSGLKEQLGMHVYQFELVVYLYNYFLMIESEIPLNISFLT